MIDYAYLCQAIADSRAGRRPTMPPSATPTLPGSGVSSTAPIELYPSESTDAAPEETDDVDSDLVEVDEPIDAAGEVDQAMADAGLTDAAGEAPPDYDSTMVYGANTDVPEPAWDADGESVDVDEEPEGEPEPDPRGV